MSGQLQTIVELNETLTRLAETEAKLAGIPEWMQELHEEHSRYQAEIEAIEAAAEQATQERRTAEAEIADAQVRQSHYQSQIGAVSTQREYGALLKEIDTTKQQISELEQQGLDALERHEAAQKQLAELKESFKDLDERYHTQLEKWENEKPTVAAEAERLRQKAAAERERIPAGIHAFFERLRERYDGAALAQVIRVETARGGNALWHCSFCSYRVRPQVVVEISSSGNVVQCDSCKRILFFAETVEETG